MAAVNVIAEALRLPAIFSFDPLIKLDAVVAAKDHELFSLLQLFLNDGLVEFRAWEANHPGVFEKYGKYNFGSHTMTKKMMISTTIFLICS